MSLTVKLKKLRQLWASPYYLAAVFKGAAAAVEHEMVLRDFDFATIIDIGGNKGQFALVSRHCCPSARIHSFEPLPGPSAILKRVFAGDELTVINTSAIGPERGSVLIHVSKRDDSSSLLPITAAQSKHFPGTEESHTLDIGISPLSDFLEEADIERPALLKIDVQGYELEALYGCADLLDAFDSVYVECSFIELYEGQSLAGDVVDYLQSKEYRLSGVYNMSYDADGKAIQADFLFKRKNGEP